MENVVLASEVDTQAIAGLFRGTCCTTGKAFKVINRLLARRFVNHVHALSGSSPSIEAPPLTGPSHEPALRRTSPNRRDGELHFDDLQSAGSSFPGQPTAPATPIGSSRDPTASSSPTPDQQDPRGAESQQRRGMGCYRMFYVPLPKTYSVERPGMNDTWQVVVTNGAKFTTGLVGEGIYLFATAKEASYFANLNNVSHIVICEAFLGNTLTVQRPVKAITGSKLLGYGYHSVHLLQSGILQVPQQDLAVETLIRDNPAGSPPPRDSSSSSTHKHPEITFYAVYHPDQVMPHFVVEVSPQGVPHRVHQLAAGDGSAVEEELDSFVQMERIDEPGSSTYDEAMVRSLKVSMEPKYRVDAVFRIHNNILKQRMFTALHDFQMRQSRLKNPCGQNVVLKFHGSPACVSIAKNGFNIASRPGMFGKAIYFADDPRKSCNFAPTGELLLCRVALGRSLTLRLADQTLTGEGLRQKGYDSITAPGSRLLCCCYAVNRTEYAIYDPDLAYPEYLIQFTKVIQKKTFRNPLCGDVLMYKVHSGLQPLWAVLFLTMLLLGLYVFVIGITMAITTPAGCNKDVSDRSNRFMWILIFTIAFVCELLPISLCCCFRAVRPVQTHFGLDKGQQELLPAPLPTNPEADAADQPFTVSPQTEDGSGCKAGVGKRVPKMILRHMMMWIVFWHILILALSILIFCINQLIQCPVSTLLDWGIHNAATDFTGTIDVSQNQFARLAIGRSGATWQVNFDGTKLFSTSQRTYCVAPLQFGNNSALPRCQQPYLALASCSSVSDFRTKMATASSSYSSSTSAPGLSDLPMIQQFNIDNSPKQFITSWDNFQYYINDNQFSALGTFILGNAATNLLAQNALNYSQELAKISATNGWPLCGAYQWAWQRSPLTTYQYDNTIPLVLNSPVTVSSTSTLNNGSQSLEYQMILRALDMGPPLQYFNSTIYEVDDLPQINSAASVFWQHQTSTVQNWTIPGASAVNGSNLTTNITVVFTEKSLEEPQVVLDFTRPRQYWQDQYDQTNWLLFIPLFVGVGLFVLVGGWLGWLYWRHPSEERVQYGDYNRKRKFKPPPVANHLPLDPTSFQTEMRRGGTVASSSVPATSSVHSPGPQPTTLGSPKALRHVPEPSEVV
eukprot:EG_transcript_1089